MCCGRKLFPEALDEGRMGRFSSLFEDDALASPSWNHGALFPLPPGLWVATCPSESATEPATEPAAITGMLGNDLLSSSVNQ